VQEHEAWLAVNRLDDASGAGLATSGGGAPPLAGRSGAIAAPDDEDVVDATPPERRSPSAHATSATTKTSA
jgi:hypothetical protein